MTVRSGLRGHYRTWDNALKRWAYEDSCVDDLLLCKKCCETIDGSEPDICLGNLPGVDSACCGHGIREQAYIRFTNGLTVRGFCVEK